MSKRSGALHSLKNHMQETTKTMSKKKKEAFILYVVTELLIQERQRYETMIAEMSSEHTTADLKNSLDKISLYSKSRNEIMERLAGSGV